jgi:hypothetical protein
MSIEDKLVEISQRFTAGGRAALSTKENVTNDVGKLVYLVIAGGVSGLRYNTTPARRAELLAAASAIGMPEFEELVRETFEREDGEGDRELDRAFYEIEEGVYSRLEAFLEES